MKIDNLTLVREKRLRELEEENKQLKEKLKMLENVDRELIEEIAQGLREIKAGKIKRLK